MDRYRVSLRLRERISFGKFAVQFEYSSTLSTSLRDSNSLGLIGKNADVPVRSKMVRYLLDISNVSLIFVCVHTFFFFFFKMKLR